MCFLCPWGYAVLESFPSSSGQETADSSSPFICPCNTNIVSPWGELPACCPCVGLPASLGQAGDGEAQRKGMGAVPGGSLSTLSPSSGDTLGALSFFFSFSVAQIACPLHSCVAPLGWVLNTEAPGRGVPDPAGILPGGCSPLSPLFSPHKCRFN